MRKIIIDANVVVKWFIEEEDSDKALILRDQFIEGKIGLTIPTLLYFEVLNALKYSKLYESSELNDAGESLEKYGFNIIEIKDDIREQMIRLAVEHDLTIYDAAYVGLSIALGLNLYTADGKIIKKLPNQLKKHVKSIKQLEELFDN